MSEKSYGLDIKQNNKKKIYKYNFNKKIPYKYKKTADVIWCSALIEHVLRPHEFLMEIKNFFKQDGFLVITAPNTQKFNPLFLSGTYHGDHVNFFNSTTFKLTLEYAGYEVLFLGSPSLGKLGQKFMFISPNIMLVAQPIPNWRYPKSAHKYLSKNGDILFKDENFRH